MVILGIDPGYAIVGYGVIDYRNNHFSTVDYGAVTTPAGINFSRRLELIYNDVLAIIEKYRPDSLSLEKLFFNTNSATAIAVAEARGVIRLAAQKCNVPAFEYTPLQVKLAVTGYGKAEKKQIMEMTRILLGLDAIPKPDDTADALAVAICHAHSSGSLIGKLNLEEKFK
ncbi:MAG TPA: crossover junction endodeoxyribonuclease RuvC [Clostridiales bacterium]|nr:crossover junction endodeoxyribonuclease RuvC [Clostridiales bacterium]